MGLCTITYSPSPRQICNDSSQNIIMMEAYPGFFGTQSHLRGLQLGSRRGRGTIPCTKTDNGQNSGHFLEVCGTELRNNVYQRLPHTHCFSHVLYFTQKKKSGNEASLVLTPAAQSPPPSVPCDTWPPGFRVHDGPWESQATSASNPLPATLKWHTDLSSMKDI